MSWRTCCLSRAPFPEKDLARLLPPASVNPVQTSAGPHLSYDTVQSAFSFYRILRGRLELGPKSPVVHLWRLHERVWHTTTWSVTLTESMSLVPRDKILKPTGRRSHAGGRWAGRRPSLRVCAARPASHSHDFNSKREPATGQPLYLSTSPPPRNRWKRRSKR